MLSDIYHYLWAMGIHAPMINTNTVIIEQHDNNTYKLEHKQLTQSATVRVVIGNHMIMSQSCIVDYDSTGAANC